MQNTRIGSALLVLILSVTLSCTKEKPGNIVQFKGIASEHVVISSGVFYIGEASTSFSGSGRTWESAEISIPDSVHDVNITLSGSVTPGYAGNLKAQIFINGELKAEETSPQSAGSTIIVYTSSSF